MGTASVVEGTVEVRSANGKSESPNQTSDFFDRLDAEAASTNAGCAAKGLICLVPKQYPLT